MFKLRGSREEQVDAQTMRVALAWSKPSTLHQVYSICGSREEDADAETMRVALAHAGKDLSTNWSAEVCILP